MPKAERRTSGARAEPYPVIRPGDKPRSTSSTPKSTTETTNSKPKTNSAPKKALADKSSATVNIPPKAKPASKSKKVASVEIPSEEVNEPADVSSAEKPYLKPAAKKATPKKKLSAGVNEAARGNATNFLELKLPGEDDDSVPMHDTCSTIRHKINDLLGKDNTKEENGNPTDLKKDGSKKPFTKASFTRAINCSTQTLDTFLKAKRLMGGAESPIYPAAYIFFEKKRIWEGKKKTAGRLKVEAE